MAHVERRYNEVNRDKLTTGGRFSPRPPYHWRPTRVLPLHARTKRVHLLRKPRVPMLPIR